MLPITPKTKDEATESLSFKTLVCFSVSVLRYIRSVPVSVIKAKRKIRQVLKLLEHFVKVTSLIYSIKVEWKREKDRRVISLCDRTSIFT